MNAPLILLSLFIFGAAGSRQPIFDIPAGGRRDLKPKANLQAVLDGQARIPDDLDPEVLNKYKRLRNYYSNIHMPTKDGQEKFYALIDLVSHDGFLEIENVCFRVCPLDYCYQVGQELSMMWALYNTAMKQDIAFVQLSTELILRSMDPPLLWNKFAETDLLPRIFKQMALNKEYLFNQFNVSK